jgi:glucokinase
MTLLAGDIGGTKSALALYSRNAGPRSPLKRAEFPSPEFPSLEAVVLEFLAQAPASIESACFGVAGPVVDGVAKATNLPWTVDEAVLKSALGVPSVRLLNDVQATAQAIPDLQDDEVETLIEGEGVARGTIGLIAPGTGLGEAFLVWDGATYRAQPSEGGHADFAPANEEQAGLLAYMKRQYSHVSYERVCSGIGIPNVYDYLREVGSAAETPEVAGKMTLGGDRTRVIIDSAFDGPGCPLCARTVEVFASILGAEAGNLALKVLANGGVYLAGGIPKNVLPALRKDSFRRAFSDKGRLSDLLSRVPVRVITGEAALLGAAIWGLEASQ